jgi:hypothetical protein
VLAVPFSYQAAAADDGYSERLLGGGRHLQAREYSQL